MIPQLHWDISFLAGNHLLRTRRFGIPSEAKQVRYPIRLLRYWFGYQLVRDESVRIQRPINVAEIGVHTGQMLQFYQACPDPPPLARWTAYDAVILAEKLKKAGYEEWKEANLESEDFQIDPGYDAVILLHILEHLFEPENAVQRITRHLQTGAMIIGGFPVVPHALVGMRQRTVRRTAAPMGHVSIFSPRRVREMAIAAGCEVDFLAGAYFLRSKGSPLENSALWMRWNLLWGALFPGWPGEIYWRMRKK